MPIEGDVAITEDSHTLCEMGSEAGVLPWAQAVWMGPWINCTPLEMSGSLLVSELL